MIDSGINQIAIGTKHFAIKFVINAVAFPIYMGFFSIPFHRICTDFSRETSPQKSKIPKLFTPYTE